jgi:heat shock protein HslJ
MLSRSVPFVALVFLLAGCASHPPPSTTTSTPGPDSTRSPDATVRAHDDLVGTVWLWQRTQMNDDSVIQPPDPSSFKLEFQADGSVTMRVDCNRGTGTYTVDETRLLIEGVALTRAYCGPDSLDQKFLKQLEQVTSYLRDGQELVLELKYDSGGMLFSPAP